MRNPHTLLRVLDIIGFRHQDKKSGVLHYSSESSECGDAFDKSCNTPLVYGGSIVSDSSLDDGFRNVASLAYDIKTCAGVFAVNGAAVKIENLCLTFGLGCFNLFDA